MMDLCTEFGGNCEERRKGDGLRTPGVKSLNFGLNSPIARSLEATELRFSKASIRGNL